MQLADRRRQMIELRPFEEADRVTMEPWFPAQAPGVHMDERWLANVVDVPAETGNPSFFVGVRDGEAVSVLSFHADPDRADRASASVMVSPESRRQGVAQATMQALTEAFPTVDEIVAYVDPANAPSLAMLKRLGLVQAPTAAPSRLCYVWRRDGSPVPPGWTEPA